MEIRLGNEVKDRITGYKGIAIARTSYLQGCDRILVQPPVLKDGTIPEGQSFDEPDLIFLAEGIRRDEKEPPGGPRPVSAKKRYRGVDFKI